MTTKGVVRVYFKDDCFKSLAVTDAHTCREVCQMFAKKLNLQGNTVSNHFQLYEVIAGMGTYTMIIAFGRRITS